jgi:hypothetical protein
VLFVRADSIYKTLPGVECYDAARDALTWPGGCPVVAHPPCRTWGSLKHLAKAPAHEHALAVWAVAQVRHWGGVLEHPARSTLFRECGCALPDGLPDDAGGFTLEVDQFHWGHLASKPTCLYVVGCDRADVPAMPHRDGEPERLICPYARAKKIRKGDPGWKPSLHHAARERTPPAFAQWLVELARRCSKHNAGIERPMKPQKED